MDFIWANTNFTFEVFRHAPNLFTVATNGSLLQAKLEKVPGGSFVCSFAGESHKFHYDLEPGDRIRMTLDGKVVMLTMHMHMTMHVHMHMMMPMPHAHATCRARGRCTSHMPLPLHMRMHMPRLCSRPCPPPPSCTPPPPSHRPPSPTPAHAQAPTRLV